jgi:hypothetical protein
VAQPFLLYCHAVTVELAPTGHRPDVGGDVPFIGEQVGRSQRFGHGDAGGEDLRYVCALLRRLPVAVDAAQQALHVEPRRLGGLDVGLVVDRHVEEDVLRVLAVHAVQAAFDDVGDLVGERRVVGDHGRVAGRQQQ